MTPVFVIDLQEREQYILKVQLTHKSLKGNLHGNHSNTLFSISSSKEQHSQ